MVLGNNQLINLVISNIESVDNDIIESIDYSFSTTFDPLYSTPNKVRAIAGSYISDISDEMLLYLIHKFSVEADNLSVCDHSKFPKWTYYAGLWVAYNVALEAILNSGMHLGNAGNKVYKKLGDFAISRDNSKTGKTPSTEMLDRLECEILKLSVSVKFCREPLTTCDKSLIGTDLTNRLAAQLVTKGGDLPRPMFGRMFMRSGEYPAMTGFIKSLDKFRLTNATPGFFDSERNGRYQ